MISNVSSPYESINENVKSFLCFSPFDNQFCMMVVATPVPASPDTPSYAGLLHRPAQIPTEIVWLEQAQSVTALTLLAHQTLIRAVCHQSSDQQRDVLRRKRSTEQAHSQPCDDCCAETSVPQGPSKDAELGAAAQYCLGNEMASHERVPVTESGLVETPPPTPSPITSVDITPWEQHLALATANANMVRQSRTKELDRTSIQHKRQARKMTAALEAYQVEQSKEASYMRQHREYLDAVHREELEDRWHQCALEQLRSQDMLREMERSKPEAVRKFTERSQELKQRGVSRSSVVPRSTDLPFAGKDAADMFAERSQEMGQRDESRPTAVSQSTDVPVADMNSREVFTGTVQHERVKLESTDPSSAVPVQMSAADHGEEDQEAGRTEEARREGTDSQNVVGVSGVGCGPIGADDKQAESADERLRRLQETNRITNWLGISGWLL
jgi:hypothetical protein